MKWLLVRRGLPTKYNLLRIFVLLLAFVAADRIFLSRQPVEKKTNDNVVHIAYEVSDHTECLLFYASIKSLMLSHHNSSVAFNVIITVPNAELEATIAEILDSWLLIGFSFQTEIVSIYSPLKALSPSHKWRLSRSVIANGFPIFPQSDKVFDRFSGNDKSLYPRSLSFMPHSNGLYLLTSWFIFNTFSGPLFPKSDIRFPKTPLDVIRMARDVLNADGYQLRQKRPHFGAATKSSYPKSHNHLELLDILKVIEKRSVCDDYRRQASVIRRKIPFFLSDRPRSLEGDQNAIAIISIASLDQIGNIESQCKHWHSGPISAAIYIRDNELASLIEMLTPDHPMSLPCLTNSKHVHLHVAFWANPLQPLPYLWNLALDHVPQPVTYVMMLDSDLMPSQSLAKTVLEKHLSVFTTFEKTAFIMPAFEADPKTLSSHPLESLEKSTLRDLYASSSGVQWFYHKRFDPGHQPTDFPRWMHATEPYTVEYKWMFEPFVVVKYDKARSMPPRAEERFIGYGWGRQSYTFNMLARGYRFVVEPDAFMMHVNHTQSPDAASAIADLESTYWKCINALANSFTRYLIRKYGNHLNSSFELTYWGNFKD